MTPAGLTDGLRPGCPHAGAQKRMPQDEVARMVSAWTVVPFQNFVHAEPLRLLLLAAAMTRTAMGAGGAVIRSVGTPPRGDHGRTENGSAGPCRGDDVDRGMH